MSPDLYAALLSWAVTLSGYPAPAVPPVVVTKPHAFFVAQACNGQPCKVLGWYAGGKNVYVDETLDPENSLFASSIVVHETYAAATVSSTASGAAQPTPRRPSSIRMPMTGM